MGMDVIGVQPKTETGEYFRNNVWYWRPLATFIQDVYPHIAEKCTYWGSNDGDGLDAEDSEVAVSAFDPSTAHWIRRLATGASSD